MTTQDKIDDAILVAVVESRVWGGKGLEIGDSIYDLEVGADRDSWFRFDEVLVSEMHIVAADALLSQYPLGYRDPKMDYSTACVWCKTWASKRTEK